jgi:TRAP-type C4-dicarboxylate transport system permease small subunit
VSLERLGHAARTALHASAVLLFAVMVLLVLAQVVARRFFEPLTWSEELARYLFIWVAFIGWVIATDRRSHIAIAQGLERARPALQRALGWFADLSTLLLMGLLLRYGLQLVLNNRDIEAVSLPIPFALVYAAVPLAATSIAAIVVVRRLARGRAP